MSISTFDVAPRLPPHRDQNTGSSSAAGWRVHIARNKRLKRREKKHNYPKTTSSPKYALGLLARILT